MSQPANLMTRMRHRLQSLAYSSSLYQLIISGPVPKNLGVVPNDPWPGDAIAGQAIMEGTFTYGGQSFPSHPPQWLPGDAKKEWLSHVHGFSWLRDLRGIGGDSARRMARSLIADWCDHYEYWAPDVWEVSLIADRLTHLVALHDFVLISADQVFRDRVFESMVRQLKHLMRLVPGALGTIYTHDETAQEADPASDPVLGAHTSHAVHGLDLMRVVRGLVFAGVALPDGDKPLGLALSLLPALLRHVMMPDGCCRERNPAYQARLLKCLIDMRHALKAAGLALPPELPTALDKACNALRTMRHADGGLMLFNGGQEGDPLFIDALLTQSAARGRAVRSLKDSGYERMHAGRMLVLVDAGMPPPPPMDRQAHAGLSSLEVSIGKERLIVNCGAHPSGAADEWYPALAATAAHSTLTLAHRNSSEIMDVGGMGRRARVLTRERHTENGRQILSLSHDGYQIALGQTHMRILNLSEEGDELRGQDVLEGAGDVEYAVRFHLHPLVQVNLIQNDRAALFRLPSGSGYRLTLDEGVLQLEESLYYGKTAARRSRQLVHAGKTLSGRTEIGWALTREKKI